MRAFILIFLFVGATQAYICNPDEEQTLTITDYLPPLSSNNYSLGIPDIDQAVSQYCADYKLITGQSLTESGVVRVCNNVTTVAVGVYVNEGITQTSDAAKLWVGTCLDDLPVAVNTNLDYAVPNPDNFPFMSTFNYFDCVDHYWGQRVLYEQFSSVCPPPSCSQPIYVYIYVETLSGQVAYGGSNSNPSDNRPTSTRCLSTTQTNGGWFCSIYYVPQCPSVVNPCQSNPTLPGCPKPQCQTAFANGTYVFNSKSPNPRNLSVALIGTNNISKRWGWVNKYSIGDGPVVQNILAGAAQNKDTKGINVGTVIYNDQNGKYTVQIKMKVGFSFKTVHIYLSDKLPQDPQAPGSYTIIDNSVTLRDTIPKITRQVNDINGDGVWIITHLQSCSGSPL